MLLMGFEEWEGVVVVRHGGLLLSLGLLLCVFEQLPRPTTTTHAMRVGFWVCAGRQ